MYRAILIAGMSFTLVANADESIGMTNGMHCWRNKAGVYYGCSGGVNTGESGFNDARTGKRYESIGGNNVIDTQTGQSFEVPSYDTNNRRKVNDGDGDIYAPPEPNYEVPENESYD
ncbi:hypothetical protein [Candidatus Methylomicrobium oryzae]|uniref:hypothetical protein n=1 Tax=Candidatus Methylomicrobium oryzae TaxID=2802053 RepID=UPI001922992C|nr:hypothetical protein [Methylomicrobium sp. RS1]MBL1263634.1 hypothetical protein [Methylomicrobium sp. RS1]